MLVLFFSAISVFIGFFIKHEIFPILKTQKYILSDKNVKGVKNITIRVMQIWKWKTQIDKQYLERQFGNISRHKS